MAEAEKSEKAEGTKGTEYIAGDFTVVNRDGIVAVVTLGSDLDFLAREDIAVYGTMVTENTGITHMLHNILLNPKIRYLIACGQETRGHYPGNALVHLFRDGCEVRKSKKFDEDMIYVKNTKAANPIIPVETSELECFLRRLREQVALIDLIGETSPERIREEIRNCNSNPPGKMEEPYAVKLRKAGESFVVLSDELAFHSRIIFSPDLGIFRRKEEK